MDWYFLKKTRLGKYVFFNDGIVFMSATSTVNESTGVYLWQQKKKDRLSRCRTPTTCGGILFYRYKTATRI